MATGPLEGTRWATIADIEDALRNWNDNVLECRKRRRHGWKQHHAIHYYQYKYWLVEFRCLFGCGCIRFEEWDENLVRVGNPWTIYPKNDDGTEAYLLKDVGRLSNESLPPVRRKLLETLGFEENIDRDPRNAPKPATRAVVGAPRRSAPRKRNS